MEHTIYSLHHPVTGKLRYVGVTKHTAAHRLGQHLVSARFGEDTKLYRWIRKLLREGLKPVWQVIEVTEDRLRECYWIAHYRAQGIDLLNCTDGGDGCANPAPEVRAKISARNTGRKMSPESKEKWRKSREGWKPSQEHRDKVAAAMRARVISPETGRKISLAKTGKPRPDWVKKKVGDAQRGKPKAPRTAEHQAKLAAARRGTKASPESIEKRRQTMMGRPGTPWTAQRRQNQSDQRRDYRPTNQCRERLAVRNLTDPPGAKVGPDEVREIRRRYAEGGVTYQQLANAYGLGKLAVCKIVLKKTWAHVV